MYILGNRCEDSIMALPHWTSFCGDLISRKLQSATELFLKCVVNIND